MSTLRERVNLAARALLGQLETSEATVCEEVRDDLVAVPRAEFRYLQRRIAFGVGLPVDWVVSRTSAELDMGAALLALVRARRRHQAEQPHEVLPEGWLNEATQVDLDSADLLFGVESDLRRDEWATVVANTGGDR